MEVNDVAKISLNGIKSGKFFVNCNFQGTMLSIATAGLAPQKSVAMAFLEVLLAGFMRFIGLFTVRKWYNTIEKWDTKQKGASLQRQDKHREAIEYHAKVLEIAKRSREDSGGTEAYGAIADCYTELGDLERVGWQWIMQKILKTARMTCCMRSDGCRMNTRLIIDSFKKKTRIPKLRDSLDCNRLD